MKISKIRRKDKGLGMKVGRINQTELHRQIQKEEGHFRCLDPLNDSCNPWKCYFKELCLPRSKSQRKAPFMYETMFYEKSPDRKVVCRVCFHQCRIEEGKRGICGMRENQKGILCFLGYRQLISRTVDPIERIPLFHFAPGTRSLSIGTAGCNFKCHFCLKVHLSQMPPISDHIPGENTTPEEIVAMAKTADCRSIAYVSAEPTIYFEYVYDIARLAVKKKLKNILVTNAYLAGEALYAIRPYLHAASVELKSIRDEFYHEYCGGKLQGILHSLRLMKEMGIWIEVNPLLVPGLNDTEEDLAKIARFIASLGNEIPWHISSLHPSLKKLDSSRHCVGFLEEVRKIGRKAGLRYVYAQNNPGDWGEDTFCHFCGNLLVNRIGYLILKKYIWDRKCGNCGSPVGGIDL